MASKQKQPDRYYSEREICDQIRGAYQQPAWTVLSSLRDGTGFATKGQAADAMAFGTWPSRGFRIIGFEIKSSRGDWMRELKNPAKAEAFARFCDEWWIVATESVVNLEEVPAGWGWATPTEKGFVRRKEPVALTPQEISRVFLMAIMRNIGQSYVPAAELNDRVEKEIEEKIEQRQSISMRELEYAKDNLASLQKKIDEFEKASGFEISGGWRYDSAKVGAVVKEVISGYFLHDLENIEKGAKSIHSLLSKLQGLSFLNGASAEAEVGTALDVDSSVGPAT